MKSRDDHVKKEFRFKWMNLNPGLVQIPAKLLNILLPHPGDHLKPCVFIPAKHTASCGV